MNAADMTPIQWAVLPLKRYADFDGRSSRAEYWWFALANMILSIVIAFLDRLLLGPVYGDLGILALIQAAVLFVPGIAVLVRRLHDTDHNGWWLLLTIWNYAFLLSGGSMSKSVNFVLSRIPAGLGIVLVLSFIAAVVVIFIFMVTPGTEGPNRYGPDPYGPNELEEVFA
jgi:uncharacterized membrane protein YhaH (DUF805 family)